MRSLVFFILLFLNPILLEAQPFFLKRIIQPAKTNITWLLRDDFRDAVAAGSISNSYASGLFPSSALGVRHVVDTGNHYSIPGGYLASDGAVNNGNPCIYYSRPFDPLAGGYVFTSGMMINSKAHIGSAGYAYHCIFWSLTDNSAFNDLRIYFESPGTGKIYLGPKGCVNYWNSIPGISYQAGAFGAVPLVNTSFICDPFGGYHVFFKQGSIWNYLGKWCWIKPANLIVYPDYFFSFAATSGLDSRLYAVNIPANYTWLPSPTLSDQFHRPFFVGHGDSITLGMCGIDTSTARLYSTYWQTNWGSENTACIAQGGKDSTWVAQHVTDASGYPALHPSSIFYVMTGANDFMTNDTVRAITYSNLCYTCSTAKSYGFTKVLVATLLPAKSYVGTDFEVQRQLINAQILGMVPTYADAVCDVGGDATIGVSNAVWNTTYYSDGVHPTEAARVIEGGIIRSNILAFYDYASSLTSDGSPIKLDNSFRFGSGGGGLTWTIQSGSWTMEASRARCNALVSGLGVVTVDPGVSNFHFDTFVQQNDTNRIGPIIRWLNPTNYIYADHDGTKGRVHEVVDGVDTIKLNLTLTWHTNNAALLRLSMNTNIVCGYYELDQIQTTTSFTTTLAASTVVGLLSASTNSWITEARQYPITSPTYDAALLPIEK